MDAQFSYKEFLGHSDGTPGQRFQLRMTPVLKRVPGEELIVQARALLENATEALSEHPDTYHAGFVHDGPFASGRSIHCELSQRCH